MHAAGRYGRAVIKPQPSAGIRPHTIFATAVIAAIIYGSLYPFRFYDTGSLTADLLHMAKTWKAPPHGRGDLLANLLLYAPLGLSLSLAWGEARRKNLISLIILATGTLLSLALELTQFYDAGRVSTLSDVYLNATGTLIGVVIARTTGIRAIKALWPSGAAPAFARLLLLAWLGWRLYPYEPTIDMHKYWHALRPLLLAPQLTWFDVFRYGALWLSLFFLIQTAFQPKRAIALFLAAVLFIFAGKILIIDQTLGPSEVLGAAAALLLSPLVLRRFERIGVPVAAGLLLVFIILSRLLPWRLAAKLKAFQWIPFFGFLHGSLQIDVIAFSEKFYLYGVMLLLLLRAGMQLKNATALLCAILLSTSVIQMFLVERSAEITDALLALGLGLLYALLERLYSARPARSG
jgi:VanZ family protein